MSKVRTWYPRRFYIIFWGLERVLWSDWSGTAFQWMRHSNRNLYLFWTRAAAQARADQLNAQNALNEGTHHVR